MKEVRDKLNQEMSRAKKASKPQHPANDIRGHGGMGVAGSPAVERVGGGHRQVAGASDTEASRLSGGDTRIRCAAGSAGEEHWVRWCWRPGE